MTGDLRTPENAAQLSLHDVAERLGLHYVTVYRYVRQGQLPARQDGRRWFVDATELEAFTRRECDMATPAPSTPDDLRRALQDGDEDRAWALVTAAGGLADPLSVQQRLIAPALREIGRLWSVGEATIAQEHRATVVATRLIARLGSPTRRGRRRGTVVVACPPGDHHVLAGALFANLVRSEGAAVIDLGRVPDAGTIIDVLSHVDGPVAVALVVSTPGQDSEVRTLVTTLKGHQQIRCVVAGGLAVSGEEVARSLGSDMWFETVEQAAAGVASASRD